MILITDVSQCADEMGISEEMLGYIMGAFHDCGAFVGFTKDNQCAISVKPL